jgi:hypothetical protein
MKCYLILRENQESGPYSLEELSGLKLKPLDLIWKETESTYWEYPTEIPELKDLVDHTPITGKEKMKTGKKDGLVFVSLPGSHNNLGPGFGRTSNSNLKTEHEVELEKQHTEAFEDLKQMYAGRLRKRKLWPRRLAPSREIFTVGFVFAGVVLGAFIVKKVVDGFNEHIMPASTAPAIAITEAPRTKHLNGSYQNAVAVDIMPDTLAKITPRIKKPKELRKQLMVAANEYKVKILGGVSDLQLTIANGSSMVIDKVMIEVRYLKPNGETVQTEYVPVSIIKPFSTKTVSAPASNRGVRIDYKIISISSRQYNDLIRQV